MYLHLAEMKHISAVLQRRKGKGSKIRFIAPLPAVKGMELEGPSPARAARELCSGVPSVPLSNLSFSSCICLKMKTRPGFHVPFKCTSLKEVYVFRYWNPPGRRQQGGTGVAVMEWCPHKAPAKWCPFLSQMKRWIGKNKSVVSPDATAPCNCGSPQKGRCRTALPCGDEQQYLTWLTLPRRGAALLTASSFRLSCADPTAHNTSQKHPGRGWSFPREDRWSLMWGWKGTEVADSFLDTDSQWKFSRKNLSLSFIQRHPSVGNGMDSHSRGSPSKTQVAFLWLGKKVDLVQYPGRDALWLSDVLWPGLTVHSYYFLPFLLETFGVFTKGILTIKP